MGNPREGVARLVRKHAVTLPLAGKEVVRASARIVIGLVPGAIVALSHTLAVHQKGPQAVFFSAGIAALVFLVVIHKLQYFPNARINYLRVVASE